MGLKNERKNVFTQRIPFKSAPIFSLACLKIHLNSTPSQILIMLLLNSGRTDVTVTGLSLTKISSVDLLTMFTYCINKNMFVHVLAPKQQQQKTKFTWHLFIDN